MVDSAEGDASGTPDGAGDVGDGRGVGSDGSPADGPARTEGGSDAAADGATGPCPAGATLVADGTSCPGTAVPTPPSWSSAIGAATAGGVAALDTATLDSSPCLPVAVCALASAPALLFSDSPETPSTDGVLYADVVGPGSFRLYVYQANGGTAARKFPVVALNQGTNDAHIAITRRGLGGTPSTDYVGVGKAAVMAWLGDTAGAGTVTVPANTRVLLDPALDALHANAQELVNAIYDVTLDAPLKLSFVSVLASEDAAMLTASLSLLPKDPNHDRGTFPGADRLLVGAAPLDATSVRKLRLGDAPLDPPLTGKDATTGAAATLGGNYGVAYTLDATTTANAAFVAFARGGDWGGGATLAGADVTLPSMQSALPAGMQAVVIAPKLAPSAQTNLELMSAGGSSLPIDLAYVPVP